MPSPEREFDVVVWRATGFTASWSPSTWRSATARGPSCAGPWAVATALLERLQANAGPAFRIEPD